MRHLKMEVVTAVAAWALRSACENLPTARDLLGGVCPRGAIDIEDLKATLSPEAKMYWPGEDEFADATTRWSNLELPNINVVVVPGTDEDVSRTVRPHNKNEGNYQSQVLKMCRLSSPASEMSPSSLIMAATVRSPRSERWIVASKSS